MFRRNAGIGILRKKREEVTDYRIELRGERRTEFPRSFQRIHLHHVFKGHKVTELAVKEAIGLSETKYCSVAATLRPTAAVSVTFEIVPDTMVAQPTSA